MITKQQVNKILKRNDFVDEKEFMKNSPLVTPYDNGCNSIVKWSVGNPKQTGESGCGEDGIYCEVCQAKREGYLKAMEVKE